jgi:AcrR family transcriptional regulator
MRRASRQVRSIATADEGGRRDISNDIALSLWVRPEGNGLGRQEISDIQRARMLVAMFDVAAAHGASNVTVADVVARSGVSRRTFYELFEDRDDCFIAAFDEGIARIAREVVPAYRRSGRWRKRIRTALTTLLWSLDDDPTLGRLLIVESLVAGPRALERRELVLGKLIAAVDEGRGESKTGAELPEVTAEGAVGAVLAVLQGRLPACSPRTTGNSGRGGTEAGPLAELAGPLVSMIVMPYLGAGAARKELERPAPTIHNHSLQRIPPNPLQNLGMRLTYRTMRVLMAVAARPGSSNRVVGEGAGISDQGQISRLLARLQGVGLVENAVGAAGRGEPNAWKLTERGREVHGAIAPTSLA